MLEKIRQWQVVRQIPLIPAFQIRTSQNFLFMNDYIDNGIILLVAKYEGPSSTTVDSGVITIWLTWLRAIRHHHTIDILRYTPILNFLWLRSVFNLKVLNAVQKDFNQARVQDCRSCMLISATLSQALNPKTLWTRKLKHQLKSVAGLSDGGGEVQVKNRQIDPEISFCKIVFYHGWIF